MYNDQFFEEIRNSIMLKILGIRDSHKPIWHLDLYGCVKSILHGNAQYSAI